MREATERASMAWLGRPPIPAEAFLDFPPLLKIFGMKDVPLELLPVGHMESFLEIEQFGESHSTINRLLVFQFFCAVHARSIVLKEKQMHLPTVSQGPRAEHGL
ncbi:uncharacterized protein LOC120685295 isoform X2 [Panicum virgatum]|uniref:uncharacterized protein LOC120651275 isoform X2 n=1 Tax=Panicum virgatum TaxID=38727 RepID=UPI0019D58068|nr:uncharacterized protein LOC120651275 isoform X2 [Panicum virgatum]XP_039823059.1 uncharacterized protein LOC120685295 isoform X2 [Panicum virgatum]